MIVTFALRTILMTMEEGQRGKGQGGGQVRNMYIMFLRNALQVQRDR